MSSTDRPRIDYRPGKAAQEAIERARTRYPETRLQDLIDRLLITGLSALEWPHWTPPPLLGRKRDRWALPAALAKAPTDRA